MQRGSSETRQALGPSGGARFYSPDRPPSPMPSRVPLVGPAVFALTLAACAAAPDGAVSLDERHPLSDESYLWGVRDDGTIHPDWGAGPIGASLPDTVGFPRQSLAAWVAGLAARPGDTLRANVEVQIAGFQLCPPCPEGAQCEPCPPTAVVGREVSPGGRTYGWFEVPSVADVRDLRVGERVVLSVEAWPDRGFMPVGARGLTRVGH